MKNKARKKPGPLAQISGKKRHIVISERDAIRLERFRNSRTESLGHAVTRMLDIAERDGDRVCKSCQVMLIREIAANAGKQVTVAQAANEVGIGHRQLHHLLMSWSMVYFQKILAGEGVYNYFSRYFEGLVSENEIDHLLPILDDCKSDLIEEMKKRNYQENRLDNYL